MLKSFAKPRPARPFSSPRIAFWNVSLKVLPMVLKDLTAREKQVIIMRYYLDKTQTEIAKELGVSQVQISRIESKVLNELKEKMTV